MENILLLVILIPLLAAIICLFAWNNVRVQKYIFLSSSVLLTAASCWLLYAVYQHEALAFQSGGWDAPFGITMVADLLSAIMVLLAAITGLAVSIYSLQEIGGRHLKFGFYPLLMFLMFSVCGAFMAGDVFNLYVWFEIMLISSFVLMALGGTKAQVEGAIKYVTINIIASAFFLAGIGLLYGLTGSLNLAELAIRVGQIEEPKMLTLASVFFFIAFGVKAAVFPLFAWLPASYHTPSATVSAIFAGLLTKVGVYAFIRFYTMIFIHDEEFTGTLLLVVAGITMVTGVLGAAAQMEFRRVLSFHIISQIGYMIMGLALKTPLALAGAVFYIMHHIIVKSNLFLISGIVNQLKGSYDLKKLGGVYNKFPFLALLFIVSAFSLAGFPPLSGFWAKFILIKAGLEIESFIIVIVALVVGFLTLYSMVKIWNEAFWKDQPAKHKPDEDKLKFKTLWEARAMVLPVMLLACITLFIGIFTEPVMQLAIKTAEQLLNPEIYIQTVLGTP